MLSSVLRSERAIQVNIAIMRVFVRLREMLAVHRELAVKLEQLEERIGAHDEQIQAVFDAIRQLMTPPETERKKIGFESLPRTGSGVKEPGGTYRKGKSKGVRKHAHGGNA